MRKSTQAQITYEFNISRTSFWRYRKMDSFPKPLPGKGNLRFWIPEEVEAWLKKFIL